MTMIDETVLVI